MSKTYSKVQHKFAYSYTVPCFAKIWDIQYMIDQKVHLYLVCAWRQFIFTVGEISKEYYKTLQRGLNKTSNLQGICDSEEANRFASALDYLNSLPNLLPGINLHGPL